MKKRVLFCLAMLLWLPALVTAQAAAAVGTRVRVGTSKERPSAGLLLAVSSDSVLIGFSDRPISPVALARSELTSFQSSLGGSGSRAAIKGAKLGMAAGAIGFGVEHLAFRSSAPRYRSTDGDFVVAVLSGAAWGLVIGAVMGAAAGPERWQDAALPASAEPLPSIEQRSAVQTRVRLGLFAEGSMVRLRTKDGQQVHGRYDGYTNDLMRVIGDSPYLVPITSVAEIAERRPMTGPWTWRGTWMGAALGVAIVVVAAARTTDEECPPDSCLSPWGYIPAFGIGGALTGATVGFLLGSNVKGWRTQKW